MKKFLLILFTLTLLTPFSPAQAEETASTTSNTTASSTSVVVDPISGYPTPLTKCPQGQYCLLEPLPNIQGVTQDKNCISVDKTAIRCINFSTFVSYAFKFMIALAVFLATVSIIYGGFEYMLSEVPFIKTEGKSRITKALYGLAAALISYVILQTIDPRLVQINTTIPPICTEDAKSDRTSVCYDKALTEFREAYKNQLSTLSKRGQEEIEKLKEEVKGKNEKIKALAAKKANGTISPTEEIELGKTTQERDTAINLQKRTALSVNGTLYFKNAVSALQQEENTGRWESVPVRVIGFADHTMSLLTQPTGVYQTTLAELKKSNDVEGYAQGKALVEFYKEQYDLEKKITQDYYDYMGYKNTDSRNTVTKTMQEWVNKFDDPTKDEYMIKYKNNPELKKQYEVIRQLRLTKIKETLAAPPKN